MSNNQSTFIHASFIAENNPLAGRAVATTALTQMGRSASVPREFRPLRESRGALSFLVKTKLSAFPLSISMIRAWILSILLISHEASLLLFHRYKQKVYGTKPSLSTMFPTIHLALLGLYQRTLVNALYHVGFYRFVLFCFVFFRTSIANLSTCSLSGESLLHPLRENAPRKETR